MSVTDPIADMLTCMRNASSIGHLTVDVPHSKIKEEVLKVLTGTGFIAQYKVIDVAKKKSLRVYLLYADDETPRITGLQRISKSSLRQYVDRDSIPSVIGGLGAAVISTSQGLMSDTDARKAGLGGEVLCYVW